MTTQQELADSLGLARETVSRILNGHPSSPEARERVFAAAEKMGYHPPGSSGRVTLKDIARACGVSHVTVSYALREPQQGHTSAVSEATRKRVRAVARAMGREGMSPEPAEQWADPRVAFHIALREALAHPNSELELVQPGEAATIMAVLGGAQGLGDLSGEAGPYRTRSGAHAAVRRLREQGVVEYDPGLQNTLRLKLRALRFRDGAYTPDQDENA